MAVLKVPPILVARAFKRFRDQRRLVIQASYARSGMREHQARSVFQCIGPDADDSPWQSMTRNKSRTFNRKYTLVSPPLYPTLLLVLTDLPNAQ
jgi:hypothetical protein